MNSVEKYPFRSEPSTGSVIPSGSGALVVRGRLAKGGLQASFDGERPHIEGPQPFVLEGNR
jgi:hypothetical protein